MKLEKGSWRYGFRGVETSVQIYRREMISGKMKDHKIGGFEDDGYPKPSQDFAELS